MFDIVTPLYNKVEFIEATIRSVLAQSFAEWRLFIVDDGSADRGPELVRRFQDPRISLIEQTNRGVGPARNTGIRAGSAEWIAFLDDDARDALRNHRFEKFEGLIAIGGRRLQIDPPGAVHRRDGGVDRLQEGLEREIFVVE